MLKRLTRDKHSNSVRKSVNYDCKRFYRIDPRSLPKWRISKRSSFRLTHKYDTKDNSTKKSFQIFSPGVVEPNVARVLDFEADRADVGRVVAGILVKKRNLVSRRWHLFNDLVSIKQSSFFSAALNPGTLIAQYS